MNLQELITFHERCVKITETQPTYTFEHQTHKDAVELLTKLLPLAKSADIEPLPGIKWNAHAVLHDALSVVPINAPTMVIWMDKDENVRHRACCTNMEGVWLLHNQTNKYS